MTFILNKKLVVLVVSLLLLPFFIFEVPSFKKDNSTPVSHRLRLCVPLAHSSALPVLAQFKGFFKQHGIELALEFRQMGKECLKLLVEHKIDIAVAYETPILYSSLEGKPIAILTEIHHSNKNTFIAYREDRAIKEPKDLKGKRIGVVLKTNGEFFLELFLAAHLLRQSDVKIVPLTATQLITELDAGNVDAVVTWDPHIEKLFSSSLYNLGVFHSSFYTEHSMLVVLKEFLESNPSAIQASISALFAASTYFEENKVESRKFLTDIFAQSGLPTPPGMWEKISVQMGLSAVLISMLTEETQWYATSENKERKDIRRAIYPTFLRNVAPELVTYE